MSEWQAADGRATSPSIAKIAMPSVGPASYLAATASVALAAAALAGDEDPVVGKGCAGDRPGADRGVDDDPAAVDGLVAGPLGLGMADKKLHRSTGTPARSRSATSSPSRLQLSAGCRLCCACCSWAARVIAASACCSAVAARSPNAVQAHCAAARSASMRTTSVRPCDMPPVAGDARRRRPANRVPAATSAKPGASAVAP